MKRIVIVLILVFLSLSLFSASFTSYRPLDREYREVPECL